MFSVKNTIKLAGRAKTNIAFANRKKGLTLLELAMALGLAVTVAAHTIQYEAREVQQLKARELGQMITQYGTAARRFMHENRTALLAVDVPNPGDTVTFNGVDFLKSDAQCGVATLPAHLTNGPYLPCEFSDVAPFSLPYSITFQRDPVVTTELRAAATFGPIVVGGQVRSDLAGLAALVANGFAAYEGDVSPFGPFNAQTDPDGIDTAASATPYTTALGTVFPAGTILVTADYSPVSDAWLRIDGLNEMQADIVFDPAFARSLVNVDRITNTNTGGVDDEIQFDSAITFDPLSPVNRRTISNVDTLTNDGAGLGAPVTINDDLAVVGEIDAQDRITNSAGLLLLEDTEILIDGVVSDPTGQLEVNDDLRVSNRVYGSQFIDVNDIAWFADPAATSRFVRLGVEFMQGASTAGPNANIIRFRENTMEFLNRAGTGRQAWTGRVDLDNLNFRVRGYFGADRGERSLGRSIPRLALMGIFNLRNGQTITKPTCAIGTPRIVMVPANVWVQTAHSWCGGNPFSSPAGTPSGCYRSEGSANYYATDLGASWRININTSPYGTSAPSTARVLAHTYCQNWNP